MNLLTDRKFTFRATRKTSWIADIIESIPDQDKAEFIRECFIEGLKQRQEYIEYVEHPERFKRQEIIQPRRVKSTVGIPKKPRLQTLEISEEDTDEKVNKLSSLYDD